MAKDPQMRKANITINNPFDIGLTLEQLDQLVLKNINPQYFCRSMEIGENGTEHFHLAIFRPSPIRFSRLKRLFPTAHIEKAYGSMSENRDYVSKGGKWAATDKSDTSVPGTFAEYGTMPSEQEETASKYATLMSELREGKTNTEIVEAHPEMAFHIQHIDILRETICNDIYHSTFRPNLEVTYLYGSSGVGKTRSIFEKHVPRDICRITTYPRNGIRFDAYHGQRILVFEEFVSQIPLSDMLNYLDIYPIMLPARYSDRAACYDRVYITSNLPLIAQYESDQKNCPDRWSAFYRRIHNVYEFQTDGHIIVHKERGVSCE
ncbi:MAG: viral replication protein [Lachnospiraceae bacterium]|nr:viral replication protein [Lachnospiraceae bacterium]